NLWIHALGHHVQAQGHQVHVSGALTVAKQATFDAVGARHVSQLCCGDTFTAVIVGVQRQDNGITLGKIAVHPLNGIRVHIWGNHLYRGRQVNDHWILRRSFHDVHHGITYINREIQLRTGEGFRGVLPAPIGVGVVLGDGLDQLCGVGSQLLNGWAILAEDNATLQLRRGIVKVHDDVLCAIAGLKGTADQVLASLDQNLDGDIIRDQILFDDLAHKVEVSLRSRRETNFNFLVAHFDQQLEHAVLTRRGHGVNQRLVAIAQVNRAPLWRYFNLLVWPRAVRQGDFFYFFSKGQVAIHRHRGAALLIPCWLAFAAWTRGSGDF